jgi:hypothetical protein
MLGIVDRITQHATRARLANTRRRPRRHGRNHQHRAVEIRGLNSRACQSHLPSRAHSRIASVASAHIATVRRPAEQAADLRLRRPGPRPTSTRVPASLTKIGKQAHAAHRCAQPRAAAREKPVKQHEIDRDDAGHHQ